MEIGIIVLLILVLLLNLKQLKKVKPVVLLALIAVGFIAGIALSQNNSPVEALNQTKTQLISVLRSLTEKNAKQERKNENLKAKLSSQAQKLGITLEDTDSKQTASANEDLAQLSYQGQQVITVNNNKPGFSTADLSTAKGPWQHYGDLDNLNRATQADALLNQSLMPKTKRERLTVNPTGWHNKRISSGWLYNRSHLSGYQLTGQNNNWKNLITATRSLNDPGMVKYEDQVADYLKASPKHYVRYSVRPVFYQNELLARGVQMRAQSVGDNSISYNIYIFNIQPGVTLNYNDGTSRLN